MNVKPEWDDDWHNAYSGPRYATSTSRGDSVSWVVRYGTPGQHADGTDTDTGGVADNEPTVRRRTLTDHPAVVNHGKGVSTWDLATFMDRLHDRAVGRVFGIGQDQYADGNKPQRFETFNPSESYEELLDELADAIAYVAFIAIKAGAVTRALEGKNG